MNEFFARSFSVIALCLAIAPFAAAQSEVVPPPVLLKIVRAEDELRFDKDLQDLLKSSAAVIKKRAALAAGRAGSAAATPFLTELVSSDKDNDVRAAAMFALGEIENIDAADFVLKTLEKPNESDLVRARALEAAGKIAAANPKNEKYGDLGEAILDALETEYLKPSRNKQVVLLGLTAALRAKPDEADFVASKFLSDKDARLRADALNVLVRLRTVKSEDLKARYRAILLNDADAVVRANAARALGASEDQQSLDLLVEAATNDDDQRVRVAAIRSLGSLNNKKAAAPLLEYGKSFFAVYNSPKAKTVNPAEKNELLEITATLGKLLKNSESDDGFKFIETLRFSDHAESPEIDVALARINPKIYLAATIYSTSQLKILFESADTFSWKTLSAAAQGAGEAGQDAAYKNSAEEILKWMITKVESERFERMKKQALPGLRQQIILAPFAISDVLRAYASLKPVDLQIVLQSHLKQEDAIVRATAAELLGELPPSKENIAALQKAFDAALAGDKEMNDAQLAILSALVKLDKIQSLSALINALNAPDFLVRRSAATLIKENDLTKRIGNAAEKVGTIFPYKPALGTKLGQILNVEADYNRAISRKNNSVKAILTTDKGVFMIDLLPEDAPLTVDNFIKLAESNYFNNIAFHRVVPNFVIQGGDPRGDGNGSPGYSIRDEINTLEFERGAVGMALSGKDTGGSQWFVTHSPQPHLDGGYTIFGRVGDAGMKVVDAIVRGDKILSVKIIENALPQKTQSSQSTEKQ